MCRGGSSTGEGQCGAVEIYNASRPDDITDMPAKFAGLWVSKGDVMAFYDPCGGVGTGTRSTGRRRRCWRTFWTTSARWSMRGRHTGWWTSMPRPSMCPPPRRCGYGRGPTGGGGFRAQRRLAGVETVHSGNRGQLWPRVPRTVRPLPARAIVVRPRQPAPLRGRRYRILAHHTPGLRAATDPEFLMIEVEPDDQRNQRGQYRS